MKEKELSSNDKRRRTTLRKKSVDELVNIVLRKDDVERKLQKSIETFKNLQEVNDKRINTIKALKETIVLRDKTIAEYKKDIESYAKDCTSISKSLYSRNKECRILFYIVIALIIAFMTLIML